MIDRDITVIDLGSDSWTRLMRLPWELAADAGLNGEESPRVVLIVYRGLKVLKAIDLGRSRALDVDWQGTSRLELVARGTGCSLVIALEETAIARVLERAQRDIDHTDDLLVQASGFMKGISAEWRRTIFTYPPGPPAIPVLPPALVQAVFRAMIPDGTLLLFALTERGFAWTSVVLGWRDGDFWLISSLDAVGMEEGDLKGEGLARAIRMLEERFSGKVRALVMERVELKRVFASRFPLGDVLLALNNGDLRSPGLPLRWKAVAITGALARSVGRLGRREPSGNARRSVSAGGD